MSDGLLFAIGSGVFVITSLAALMYGFHAFKRAFAEAVNSSENAGS